MKSIRYRGSLYREAGAMKVFVDGKIKAWDWVHRMLVSKQVVYWDQSGPDYTLYTGPDGDSVFKLFSRVNPKGDRKKLIELKALKDLNRTQSMTPRSIRIIEERA